MIQKRYLILFVALLSSWSLSAQKEVRQQLRKGNTAYRDSLFIDAEVAYRKAIDAAPVKELGISYFNLGNTLIGQSKLEEALQEFARSADIEQEKPIKSQSLHNMGVIFQADEQYDKAIDVYKESLRNNPHDDETRYNLALAMKQREQQDQDDEGEDENEDQDKEQDQNEDKEQEQQQDQDKKDDQNKDNQADKNPEELSKEAAEQLLNAIMQDEKRTQEKVQKRQVLEGNRRLEKDW